MDALKKAAGKLGHHDNDNAGGQKDDYGDKGAEYVNKKVLGDKLSREQREKATDAGRAGFEKATGKKVPSNISN